MPCDRSLVFLGVLLFQLAVPVGSYSQDSRSPSVDATNIRFKMSEEPTEMNLFRADAKLLEQKFAASVRLHSIDQKYQISIMVNELDAIRGRAEYKDRSILFPTRRRAGREDSGKTLSDFFRQLAEAIPKNVRPTDDDLRFFLSEDANAGYVDFDSLPRIASRQLRFVNITILAPSREVAESRTRTLVSLLKLGIADPIKEQLEIYQEELDAELESRRTKIETSWEDLRAVKKKLDDAADLVGVDLARLKTQRRSLDVEVAGVRGRIRAVEKLRTAKSADEAIEKKLDEIKMTLEIDLAGLAARKEALTEIIKTGEQRVALENESKQLGEFLNTARERLSSVEQQINRRLSALKSVESLCLPYANEVTIASIKWTK